jgi:hypothetical protein
MYQHLNSHPNPRFQKMISARKDGLLVLLDGSKGRVAYVVFEEVSGPDMFDFISLGAFDDKICRFFFK